MAEGCDKINLSDEEKRKRGYKLKARYGITWKEYDDMWRAQHGCCAICGKKQSGKLLSVDHNHTTGFIRGLLCISCNTFLLQTLRDRKRVARGLVEYLTRAIENDKTWRE